MFIKLDLITNFNSNKKQTLNAIFTECKKRKYIAYLLLQKYHILHIQNCNRTFRSCIQDKLRNSRNHWRHNRQDNLQDTIPWGDLAGIDRTDWGYIDCFLLQKQVKLNSAQLNAW